MRLYHQPRSRSLRVLWALEEMELPFELVGMDHPAHQLNTDAYRRLSPFEQIPAIDDDGLVLTLMKAGEVVYPKTFHIGFGQESDERVNEIYQRMRDDGFEADPPQHSHAWTFYVRAPGGFVVEVMS